MRVPGWMLKIIMGFLSEREIILNPQPAGGGANWPTENQKNYISGTECPIDLKPGCKFKFVSCQEIYLKTFWNIFLFIVELYQGPGDPLGPSWTPKWTLRG